jgi:hypothetical protein
MMQSNPHGVPMPQKSTALLVAAVVAGVWSGALVAMDFVAAGVVVGAVAVVCAVLGVALRARAGRPGVVRSEVVAPE